MENIIEVNNLTKKYNKKIAVFNLSFKVRKGEFFGLLGHNGAGKSTTIECILGLKKCDKGGATIFGRKAEGINNTDSYFAATGNIFR